MPYRLQILLRIAVLAGMLGACVAPGPDKPTNTAELGAELKKSGVAWDSTAPAPQPKGGRVRFDEAVILKGVDLWVELIRIDDKRIYDLAESASQLLTISEAVAGQPFPGKPKVYTRQPFLVIVRQEPAEGSVLAALNEVMPPAA